MPKIPQKPENILAGIMFRLSGAGIGFCMVMQYKLLLVACVFIIAAAFIIETDED